MKTIAAIGVTFLALVANAYGQNYTNASIANIFVSNDEKRGMPTSDARIEQVNSMLGRVTEQCHNNLSAGQEAENIGNMVIFVRQKLDAANIPITHYELLDVLYSTLADGRSNWDCAAVLSVYLTTRTADKAMTHIAAYKTVQGLRDTGMIGLKSS
ncbi:hypothetical protein [Pseudomonas anguilliseptica]|uniref:Uncharacterized protein n=1 Tax=Pseudomonas anguilliseptica TaxID=53406 RepID=A0A1H4XVY3_PSEAG|nr:hypothetical protein [Pseudomonas anguilliseptica]SED09665.1 hypothetical protein SAMN05421553_2022 [Pseudomonas anguilliseptica]